MKQMNDNKDFIFDLTEEALRDAELPGSLPSEYYEELVTISDILDEIGQASDITDQERKRAADLKTKISAKIKLKAFW